MGADSGSGSGRLVGVRMKDVLNMICVGLALAAVVCLLAMCGGVV